MSGARLPQLLAQMAGIVQRQAPGVWAEVPRSADERRNGAPGARGFTA